MRRASILAVAAVFALMIGSLQGRAQAADPPYYSPTPGAQWQWQLDTPVDLSVDAPVYDIDGFDNDASVVEALHAKGRKAVCYISAGSWENWRPDAADFPAYVKGRSNGWAGEKWLDIRRIDVLKPIMEKRFDMCKAKGFDAVEPDNVDGYTNRTGFPLTAADQLAYNKMLAEIAHARGLGVALKNDVDQVAQLEPYFDFAINEQCQQYNECGAYDAFTSKGKAVWQVEYKLSLDKFCPQAKAGGRSAMKKNLSLDAYRQPCV